MMSRSVQLVRRVLSTVLLVSIAAPTLAQQNADTTRRTAPQTDLPLIPTRPLKFTTDEGTWMSLDVSQDGKTIVFDLLGDIYTVPIGGGSAKRITSGSGFDGQPRFSPDGKSIVFVSDRSGSENLYLVDPEGQRVRPLTTGRNQAYVSPDFTPDGQYIVVSRSNDLWLYHKDGGSGLRLTGQTQQPQPQGGPGGGNQPNNFMGASVAPDGRYIYASARTGPAGYNQMLGSTQIVMYDRNTGRLERRTLNLGTGFRPAVSPDGKWLAYGSRRMAVTGLKLRELASGDEKWLATDIQRDDIESRGSRDLLPGYSWTPDSKALVLTRQGKIWRVDAATGQQSPIPFTAEVDQMLADLVRFEYPVNDSTLTVRQIRGARPSPNGKRLVFSALDRLWAMDLPGCPPAQACSPTAGGSTAKRLTTSDEGEHSPVWSPDGKYIAYVSWTEDGGDIWRIPAAGGKPEKLTKASAFYDEIAYSPNGARIVAVRAPREQRAEINDEINPKLVITDLVWIPAAGGQATLISPLTNAERPHFSNDSTRVWVYDDEDGLVSMRWDGTDRKAHLIVTGFQTPGAGPNARPRRATQLQVSPDGMRVLAQVDNKLYVVPLPVTGGQTPTVSVEQPNNSAIPFRRLSRIGGDFLGWNADSKGLFYSMGRAFFQYDLVRADSLAADSTAKAPARPPRPDSTPNAAPAARGKPVYEPVRTDVAITVPKDRPSGTVVLRGARIITMKGDEVIPRGDIVVTNNRIVAVGAEGSVTVPAGARTIDASGKTIMPGLVDVHAHMWPQWGVHSPQPYMYTVNLAYGVTTTRDPQTSQADVVSYGDAVDVGQMIGPRVLATGPGIFAYDNVTSADDAKEVMKRYSEFYLTETIKQYMAGDRRQRQWIAMAAKEQRITPTLEGGLDFKKNMTEAMDGYAGIEHTLPIAPMYKDAIEMFAKSGTTWTPTLLVQYGGPWAENWWYEHYDILNDPKLTHFTPFLELERRALRRPQWFRDSEYSFKLFAEQAKKLVEAGGRVGLGGHGQLQGLGVHWELWNIGSGGMKPIDVLRVGTIYGAESIGLGKQIGTVEAGKLADLLVLDANPLDDIKNTNTIRYVMKNGRVYEGNTLNEIWPRQRPMPKQWWMTHDALTPPESGTGGTAQSPTTRR